ncbi:MAG: homoserine kinase [Anaerovibrio sp.]|uniref:homoserine kinase n=1 Tax=Anaerovibrio sp. TaxID=1872532 RepID=UPI0025DDDE80|nr:homoserine kinase [Anaerovibrio sp.]MCR5176574.1 homoserine kinase [Anaerovibrio sp.]
MEAKKVKIRVPGTSANLGAGFDTLGISCSCYNELELELYKNSDFQIEVYGEGAGIIPQTSQNIVYKSILQVLEKVGAADTYKGAHIVMHNSVPLSRGLGSSAAAIVGGLKAANEALGAPLSQQDLLQLATDIEGHPDNVAPALFGGMTISVVRDGCPKTFCFMPRLNFKMVVAVPDFYLPTKAAREVLPDMVSRADAITNIGSTAMLIATLMKGSPKFLAESFEDRLHQQYRAELIPGMRDVFAAAKEAGAMGAFLSGAGPCLIAITSGNEDKVGKAMQQAFSGHEVNSSYMVLSVDRDGATLLDD